MAKQEKKDGAENVEEKKEKEEKKVEIDPKDALKNGIKKSIILLLHGSEQMDFLLIQRALRSFTSTRKKMTADILAEMVQTYCVDQIPALALFQEKIDEEIAKEAEKKRIKDEESKKKAE